VIAGSTIAVGGYATGLGFSGGKASFQGRKVRMLHRVFSLGTVHEPTAVKKHGACGQIKSGHPAKSTPFVYPHADRVAKVSVTSFVVERCRLQLSPRRLQIEDREIGGKSWPKGAKQMPALRSGCESAFEHEQRRRRGHITEILKHAPRMSEIRWCEVQ